MVAFARTDLHFILTQIRMAESGQPPVNPHLPFGLHEVSGSNNSAVPRQASFVAVTTRLAVVAVPTRSTVAPANDRLTGDDRINGGSGTDVFVFAASFGNDTIVGFDGNARGGQDLLISAPFVSAPRPSPVRSRSPLGRSMVPARSRRGSRSTTAAASR